MALSPTLPTGAGLPVSHDLPRLPDIDVNRAKAAELARQAQLRRAAAAASKLQIDLSSTRSRSIGRASKASSRRDGMPNSTAMANYYHLQEVMAPVVTSLKTCR